VFSKLVHGISESRNIAEQEVRSAIDIAPLLSQEALKIKFVDGLKYLA
jgi:hypothetical protein